MTEQEMKEQLFSMQREQINDIDRVVCITLDEVHQLRSDLSHFYERYIVHPPGIDAADLWKTLLDIVWTRHRKEGGRCFFDGYKIEQAELNEALEKLRAAKVSP